MRLAVVATLVVAALFVGGSSSAGVFPDLPGVDMLEEATAGQAAKATTSSNAPPSQERVPTPDSSAVTRSAAAPEQIEIVTALPGAGNLPILKDVAPTTDRNEPVAPLVLLAALFVLGFSRFLFRLNELGRR